MSQIKPKKYSKRKKLKSPWPLIALAVGALLLIFSVAAVFSQQSKSKVAIEVAGSPSLKVDKDKIDLGNVKLGKYVEASFKLSNVGDKTLRFTEAPYIEVKEGC